MRLLIKLLSSAALLSCAAPAMPQGESLTERGSLLQVVEPNADDRALRMTPVVRAVQRAADSVVSIYLQNQLARRKPVTEGQGSGVILDDSGLVITNWHVIAPVLLGERSGRSYGVLVKLRDGREREARVLSSTPTRDLALLQLKLQGDERVQPIEIGRSSDLMIGETVIAIGNPQGQANTVTSGVLSASGRSIQVRAPDGVVREYEDLLQTDAAINQGNSGGALLDITGRLVGINNAMSAGAENIGFAIPMDIVRIEFQRQLLQSTSFVASGDAAWLGLEVADRDGNVVVDKVTQGGPAQRAGVRRGDLLRRLGDQPVQTSIDYLRRFFVLEEGEPVTLTLERGGRSLRAEARPISRAAGEILTSLGLQLDEVDVETNQRLVRRATYAFYRGSGLRRVALFPATLRVTEVVSGSPADEIGIEGDDLIIGVVMRGRFGQRELPLHSKTDLARLCQEQRGDELKVVVLRGERDLVGTIPLTK